MSRYEEAMSCGSQASCEVFIAQGRGVSVHPTMPSARPALSTPSYSKRNRQAQRGPAKEGTKTQINAGEGDLPVL